MKKGKKLKKGRLNGLKRASAVAIAVLAGLFGYDLVADDNNLEWVNPTTNEDGSALTDLEWIRVYHSFNGEPFYMLAQVPGAETSYLHANQNDGEHCYYVTAVRVTGAESVPSNEACKVIDTILPNPPGLLTVN